MFKKWQKPKLGYKKNNHVKKQRSRYVSSLFISPSKKISVAEKVVKTLIYIALRIVIRPSKWRDSNKNYEIIDRTYKRIMSSDFIYIPSSIAFYIIMAFMPVLSIISFLYSLEPIRDLLESGTSGAEDSLQRVVGKFIPGITDLISQIKNVFVQSKGTEAIAAHGTIIFSLLISTWIASGGFAKLVYTQSYLFNHKFVGGYWMNRLKGFVIVILFTLYLFVALVINILVEKWISTFGWTDMAKNAATWIFLLFGLFFLVFFGFWGFYRFTPRFKTKFLHILPGTMVTTIPTVGFLAFFGTITSLWSYKSYGVIGTIMYIGMSALIITYFIFMGIIVNASYQKTFIGETKNKWTISKK